MSTYQKYDPELFVLQRATAHAATTGSFILGKSHLGRLTTTWTTVPAATFTYTSGYQLNDAGILIIQPETATVSLSYWGTPGAVLYPTDKVRASYDGEQFFYGTVVDTSISYETDPEAATHGVDYRVDFSASCAGTYAILMGRTVSWVAVPNELPIRTIRRWINVEGWVWGD